ncbi:MAG: ABC transporter substrate-binding protein [Firmicutes bacterium]|nr:ABC transporter substrate-binding protein [Bacillota bacterium]
MKRSVKLVSIVLGLVLILGFASVALAMEYKEAPMLAEKVKAGALPPIEERLPKEPFIVGPGVLVQEEHLDWQPGVYGGTMKSVNIQPDWQPDFFLGTREALVSVPGLSSGPVMPNLVSSYSVNDDNTEFTFTIREGLRWSDGVLVTTEDVRFVFEDIYLNEELTPVYPVKFRSAGRATGETVKLTIVDDLTFILTFDEPYGSFLTEISIKGWEGYSALLLPSHFLKNYHIKYTPAEDLLPELEEQEFGPDEWYRLFSAKNAPIWDLTKKKAVGFPSLNPWVAVEAPGGVLALERNPYYHKVDITGQQLPYIDRLESHHVNDIEVATMRILTGDVDIYREGTALNKMPLYKENEERGGYVTLALEMHVDPSMLYVNLTYEDDGWREVARDIRFRKAINLAVDREEVIDSIYFGMASMPTWVPAEYDPAQANKLLDEIMPKRNADGWRLRPDGEVFELFIEVADYSPDFIPVSELLTEYLKDVGIFTTMRQISQQLRGQKGEANELNAVIGWAHSPGWPWLYGDYLPGNWGSNRNWELWYNSGGRTGEEPPAWIKDLYDIHEQVVATVPGTPERDAVVEALREWYASNYLMIQTVESVLYPYIVNADLRNVPESGMAVGANLPMEQYFFGSK